MTMLINHNLFAKNMAGLYNKTTNALQKSLSKLSSGLRVSVTDFNDASGMEIAQQMASKLNGYSKAMAGGQDGISLLQTAEGALTEVDAMLVRMRELANQAANDTLTGQDRAYIQAEIDQLRTEIDRVGNTTHFNNKKLLNGNAAALWSAIPKETQAIIKGSLNSIDQFGQTAKTEGNYNIKLMAAPPGEAEVQKSSVFKIKSEGLINYQDRDTDKIVNITSEGLDLDANGDYTIKTVRYPTSNVNPPQVSPTIISRYGTSDVFTSNVNNGTLRIASPLTGTAEIVVTYQSLSDDKSKAYFTVEGYINNKDGTVSEIDSSQVFEFNVNPNTLVIGTGQNNKPILTTDGNATGVTISGNYLGRYNGNAQGYYSDLTGVAVGTKALFVMGRNGSSSNAALAVTTGSASAQHSYYYDANSIAGKDITLNQLSLDSSGNVKTSSITLSMASDLTAADLRTGDTLATISKFDAGAIAKNSVTLRDVDQFYEPESGKFLLDEPQTIKITQGDGKTASVTLYASDTLGDVAKKLNSAIADDLGQAKYVDDASKFATFVDETVDNTSESVAGTLLIRSAISGSKGTLRFSGSEEMINALGLNTIQEATESVYTADVTDAHSGAEIASVKVTGNTLNGVLNQNVDVEFDAMAGVIREWDANSNSYKYNVSEYKSTVHLADNTLTLQMGIGSNESMFLSIGDMRSQALGLNDVLVTDRESAARSLSIIDNAIDKVSTQRAKLGAYTNRIEYNLDNMRIAEQNITAANSNIQDTDMAKEMINFTKLQIMLQAGNSMMAQANQTQESVLSLLR